MPQHHHHPHHPPHPTRPQRQPDMPPMRQTPPVKHPLTPARLTPRQMFPPPHPLRQRHFLAGFPIPKIRRFHNFLFPTSHPIPSPAASPARQNVAHAASPRESKAKRAAPLLPPGPIPCQSALRPIGPMRPIGPIWPIAQLTLRRSPAPHPRTIFSHSFHCPPRIPDR